MVLHELAEQRHHPLAVRSVQVAGGLVGQQKRGLNGEGPGDGHPLLLAAGHFSRDVRFAVGQPHHLQLFDGSLLGLRGRNAVQLQRQGDIFLGSQNGQEIELLEDKADPAAADEGPLVVGHRGQIDPFQQNLTGRGNVDTAEQRQERALSRTRAAHDRQQFPLLNPQVDPSQGLHGGFAFAKRLSQGPGFEDKHECRPGGANRGNQSTVIPESAGIEKGVKGNR